jgi:hypothetical protein
MKEEEGKVKGKVVSMFFNRALCHEGVLGKWRYSSTHSLTSALDGGDEGHRHVYCTWFYLRNFNKSYGLDDRMIGVRFPAGAGNFSLRYRVHTGSGAHPASYPYGFVLT